MTLPAPLAGRLVLLLRPEDRADELGRRLRNLGARTIHAPVLSFVPPRDEEAARAALAGVERYDLLVFTSRTGAHAFVERARRERPDLPFGKLKAAAVGPGTAAALRAHGIEPVLVATASRAEGLRAEIERLPSRPATILVVRPEGGGAESFGALRERGSRVDEAAFYRTVPAPGVALAVSTLASGTVDAVVFTSPSTLRFLLEFLGPDAADPRAELRRTRRVAIGPVTAEALAAAGLDAHAVAVDPTAESVCEAVLRALRSE